MLTIRPIMLFILCLLLSFSAISADTDVKPNPGLNEASLKGLEWRSIGPSMTAGRIADIAVNPKNRSQWFVGVGSGAFSYLNGSLYATSFSINRYDELLTRQPTGITRSRPLSHREQLQYHLLTSLFGLSLKKETTVELFGDAGWRSLWPEITGLSLIGAIGKSPGEISLTRRGQYYWLVAMREFLTGVNNFRDEMRAHIKEEYEASYGESIPLVTVD